MIPLVLNIYAILFRTRSFDAYVESCFWIWILFLRFKRRNYNKALLMFLSDIFYWITNNHPILQVMKTELPKFSDTSVEIFHSLLRRNTEKYLEADQIIREARYLNYLCLDDEKFKKNFVKIST
jgi:hypothetical protein